MLTLRTTVKHGVRGKQLFMKTFFLILVIRQWVFLKPTLTVVKGYLIKLLSLYVGVVVSL